MIDQAEPVQVGHELPPFRTQPLDPIRIRMFSEAMRDPNPVHLDDEFARSIGLPSVIGQGGVAVVALAHVVARWAGRDAVEEIDVRLRAPVLAGERLVCQAVVTVVEPDHVEVACRATNEAGELRAEGSVRVRR